MGIIHRDIPTSRCYQSAAVDVLPQNYRVNQNNLFSSGWNEPGGVGCRWNATLLIILRGCDSGNFLGVHYPTLPPTVHLESKPFNVFGAGLFSAKVKRFRVAIWKGASILSEAERRIITGILEIDYS